MTYAKLSVRRCLLLGMFVLAVTSLVALGQRALLAAATPEQTQKLRQIDKQLKAAETQFRGKKYDDATTALKEAQTLLAEVEKVPEFANQVAGLKRRIDRVQSQIEAAAAKGSTPAGGNAAGGRVSFVRSVAPLLVTKCGRCHVNDNKGEFNMATYELLKQGPKDGVVVMPGKGSGSRLVEVIESGDMPRGGAKVSKQELDLITKWIDEGARFDGRDSNTPLVRLVSSAAANAAAEPAELKVVAATGKETVSYSKDIAPVLLASCVECHTAQRQQGRLCMDNFELFMKGGASGNPWIPEDPAESILIKKLKGTLGQRMPFQRDPLSDETIAKFEKWIAEGAKFDGGNSTQATPVLVRNFKIKTLSHEQLAKERVESSQQKWRLASPSGAPALLETKNFLIMGRTSETILDEVGKIAEEQATAVARVFRAPLDKPLVKGRMTLFVFPGRYDYSEFGQMVESRKLPPEWRGHFGVDISDVFGVFVLPDSAGGSDYTLAGIVGQQVAAAYIGSLSNVPNWFADGCGHVYAAKVDPKSNRVKQWNDRFLQTASAGRLDQLLGRGLTPEETEAASYGFVKSLMNNSGKFNALLMALRKGDEFDQAFARTFGEPKAVLAAWVKSQ